MSDFRVYGNTWGFLFIITHAMVCMFMNKTNLLFAGMPSAIFQSRGLHLSGLPTRHGQKLPNDGEQTSPSHPHSALPRIQQRQVLTLTLSAQGCGTTEFQERNMDFVFFIYLTNASGCRIDGNTSALIEHRYLIWPCFVICLYLATWLLYVVVISSELRSSYLRVKWF